ncbi:ATP-binding protein [Embleya sp. MST-111070]|uniref:ATP-binding protein n=1 Tax=Embleya sp. MST-111070 TaxID=3398231 RepID=UPI003F732B96
MSVLADIPMGRSECLAELIDNALHRLEDAGEEANGAQLVLIDFEAGTEHRRQSSVVVRDNGPGMDGLSLERAFAAGWTDREARHHEIGIGLTVATARLGRHITLRSTRALDLCWTVIAWDLSEAGQPNWAAAVWTERKAEAGDHGTEITIRGLREPWQQSMGPPLRRMLGDKFGYLLREGKLRLSVNGRPVPPRLHCVWAENRTVRMGNRDVNAVQPIDVPLPTSGVCADCRHAATEPQELCARCGGERFTYVDRRITGWIGVQRYTDDTDYGIDFLRNGRKILTRDKSLFTWRSPDDDTEILEYPEMRVGRIVGEVHCDHVPVAYSKNAFDYESPEWQQVVRAVRGDGPLGVLRSKQFGYPPNLSPLGIIFGAYRRTDPGLRYLFPGDGRTSLANAAREWGRAFHRGDPAYASDEIWYAAAQRHTELCRDGGTKPRRSV